MNYLLQALIAKLKGELEVAKANVMVYTRNSTGIGEHPEISRSYRDTDRKNLQMPKKRLQP